MILSPDIIASPAFQAGKFERHIPDTDDMYGWVCGDLDDDEARPTLQYSELLVSGEKHRRIFERGRIHPIQERAGGPVIAYAECTCIHRGKWAEGVESYWVIHFVLRGQS